MTPPEKHKGDTLEGRIILVGTAMMFIGAIIQFGLGAGIMMLGIVAVVLGLKAIE